jgi:phage baseplate assembly protein W
MSSIYSDIPYDLNIDEFGDLVVLEDSAAIKQSLRTIVMTRLGTKTKFQNPIFGSATADLLFEKLNPFTISNLEQEVEFAIENWEPRIKIDAIAVDSDISNHKIKISITYSIVALNITESITINLSVLS